MSTEEITGAEDAIDADAVLGTDIEEDNQDALENNEDERDWEGEARDMGWVPEGEWKGDRKPAKFFSAQEFVERGETVIPILKSRLQERDERLERLEKDFNDRVARIERTSKSALDKQKARYEAEKEDLRKQMRAAASDGDVEKFDELAARADRLDKEAAEPEIDDEPQERSVDDEFTERNDWYNVDDDMTAFAQGYSQRLMGTNPNMSRSEMFKKVEAKVKETFPEKFGTQRKPQPRNGHAAVDGGSDAPAAPGNRGNLAAKLPSEARTAGQGFVKEGLFKNLEEYAKEYFNG